MLHRRVERTRADLYFRSTTFNVLNGIFQHSTWHDTLFNIFWTTAATLILLINKCWTRVSLALLRVKEQFPALKSSIEHDTYQEFELFTSESGQGSDSQFGPIPQMGRLLVFLICMHLCCSSSRRIREFSKSLECSSSVSFSLASCSFKVTVADSSYKRKLQVVLYAAFLWMQLRTKSRQILGNGFALLSSRELKTILYQNGKERSKTQKEFKVIAFSLRKSLQL